MQPSPSTCSHRAAPFVALRMRTSEKGGSEPGGAVTFVIPFSGYEKTIAFVLTTGATKSFVVKLTGDATTTSSFAASFSPATVNV